MMRYYSWKTTAAGIFGAVALLLSVVVKFLNGESPTEGEWVALAGALSTAVGVLLARDDDKTSKEVGAEHRAGERAAKEAHKLTESNK